MQGKAKPRRRMRQDAGVAAIEFAIVLPVLLLLFFGMVNLTSYISTLRKLNSAAELVADQVSRHNASPPAPQGTIQHADFVDYFDAAALLFLPSSASNVQVQVYNFRLVGGTPALRWQRFRLPGTAGTCTAPDPTDPEIAAMMANGDALVAVACIPNYTALAQFPGVPTLTVPRKQYALRPRQTQTLLCTGC